MKLGSFFVVMLVSVMLGLSSAPAEAKRFGGGSSFGKSYKYKRDAKPFQTPAKPSTPASNPAAAGAAGTAGAAAAGKAAGGRSFLGPLAGLAAGGLLAAMFFGGAFEGIQILDILLIVGIVFLIMMFLRKRSTPAPAPAGAQAGGGQWQDQGGNAPQQTPAPMQRESAPAAPAGGGLGGLPEIGSGLKGESLTTNPAWFNEAEFMAEANDHFRALQKHWDAGDMDAIAEYSTPEMAQNLRNERAALTSEPHTEVIDLYSQMLDLVEDGDKIVAAILFSGLINEDRADSASQFAEIWHIEHAANSADGDWKLAGIIQHHL